MSTENSDSKIYQVNDVVWYYSGATSSDMISQHRVDAVRYIQKTRRSSGFISYVLSGWDRPVIEASIYETKELAQKTYDCDSNTNR